MLVAWVFPGEEVGVCIYTHSLSLLLMHVCVCTNVTANARAHAHMWHGCAWLGLMRCFGQHRNALLSFLMAANQVALSA